VFNGGLDRSIDGVRDYGWRPLGTEEHKSILPSHMPDFK